MATKFNRELLEGKLRGLSSSQQSIQTLSLWLIHHGQHADVAVEIWLREVINAPAAKKLNLMYLASDAILQSRKRGPEIRSAFQDNLQEALNHVHSDGDEKTHKKVGRLIDIWDEREAFPKPFTTTLRLILKPPEELFVAKKIRLDKNTPVVEFSTLLPMISAVDRVAEDCEKIYQKTSSLPLKLFSDDCLTTVTDVDEVNELESSTKEARVLLENAQHSTTQLIAQRMACIKNLEIAIAQQELAVSSCQVQLTTSKEKLELAAKAKRELRQHLGNMPKTKVDLEALPHDLDMFDDVDEFRFKAVDQEER